MIVTFAHYKGGTGKTTSCISVAGWLAKKGKKVLVVDLDPQANATSGLGVKKNSFEKSMYHVMNKKIGIKNIILEGSVKNLHVAPSTRELELANLKIYDKKNDVKILKDSISAIKDYYDFILVDTPPVNGHFITNGMAAADKVILVLDPGIFALEGVEVMQKAFGEFFGKIGLDLKIDNAIVTKAPLFSVFNFNSAAKEIKNETEVLLGKKVFMIPHSYLIYGSQLKGIPISHYKPWSFVGMAYEKIADGLIREECLLRKNSLEMEK